MILFKQTDKKFIRMATRGDRNLSTRILNIIISLVETREIIIFSILVERFLSPLVSHQINSFSFFCRAIFEFRCERVDELC